MLLQLVLFFTLASVITTVAVMVPGFIRARAWASIPLGLAILAGAGWLTGLITQDAWAATILPLFGVGAVIETRRHLPQWSMLAAQLLALLLTASAVYLIYAAVQPFADGLGPLGLVASFLLLLLEASALALSVYYLFEILDGFSRRTRIAHRAEPSYRPKVAMQVPCYNEPIEVMRETLTALAHLDYQDVIVQVVDNNTRDPKMWRPLEALCEELGPRFQFLHLEPWPGYKAGALNEATRRLPKDVGILGIVDADYLVKPGFLKEMVGHFADERVAFVQTPQNYRDWKDSGYLRGLFYSYRYFFDITMPARANRNAIIFAGTMGLIRRSALERIGGWDENIITEDAEASLRLLGLGSTGVYEPTVWGRRPDAVELRRAEEATIPMGARRDPDLAPPMAGAAAPCPTSASPDVGPAACLPVRQRPLVLGFAYGWLHRPPAADRRRRRPASPAAGPRAHRADPGRAPGLLDHRRTARTLGVAAG